MDVTEYYCAMFQKRYSGVRWNDVYQTAHFLSGIDFTLPQGITIIRV